MVVSRPQGVKPDGRQRRRVREMKHELQRTWLKLRSWPDGACSRHTHRDTYRIKVEAYTADNPRLRGPLIWVFRETNVAEKEKTKGASKNAYTEQKNKKAQFIK